MNDHDRFRCGGRFHKGCGAVFHFKRPERQVWISDPGPDRVTGRHDPERGHSIGDPHPTCPRCGSVYVRKV